jgi:hypothetical protein
MPQRAARIADVAERQYGVFSHEQAIHAGYSHAAIQRKVQDGTWRRVCSGVYAIAGVPLAFGAVVFARTLQVGEALASHRTAAALYGLEGFTGWRRIELVVFDRRGIASTSVVVHRPRVWLAGDAAAVAGIPATSACRTVFDLATICPLRRLEIAFDDALRKGLVTVEEMARRMDAVRRPGVRGLKKMATIITDRSANDLEDSELETIFRKLITGAGLPLPVGQYTIWRDDGSFVAEVDFAYPEIRLAIELDSWTFHGSRRPFEKDRVQDYELFDLGWDTLRFTKSDLRRRGERVVGVLGRRLRIAGPTSSRPAI